jgi:phosphatidylinositol alpha-mannosyltransferase
VSGPGRAGPLTVALVCPYSLSRPGGVQGQVVGLARSLEARGHRAVVFAPVDAAGDAPAGCELVATGRSVALPANGSLAPVSLSPAAARRGLGALRRLGPDVVHLHEPFAPGLTYAVLAAHDPPPLVGTFHRSGGSTLYRLLGPLARRMAARIDLRCAVSEAAAATARHALGGTYDILFNGVEDDRYDVTPWPTDGPTVLFLGRHEERKGLAVLLEAWDRVVAASGGGPAPRLWVAGDGPATAALRDRYPDGPSRTWLGVLSEEEKDRRLVAADALAAPALGGESFGLVLLEGMAARTVVVASDIDGYRDAAGGCAVLVPPADPEALAAALAGVLDGTVAADRADWLDRGAERAAGWSMDALAERYEDRYRTLVVGDRP